MKHFKKLSMLLIATLLLSFAFAQGNQTQERTQLQDPSIGTQETVQTRTNTQQRIQIGNEMVETNMQVRQENTTQIMTELSNGRNAEIKVMPETASNTAITRLQSRVCTEEEGCQIQLKEVTQQNEATLEKEIKAAYEIQTKKEVKLFGLFKAQMTIRSQINAENGEVIRERKPRWSFLASFANNNGE